MIINLNNETWYKDGLCLSKEQDIFFPERGASTRQAKAFCRTCPVIEDCLDFLVRHEQEYGVWGGVLVNSRRTLLKQKSNRV